jgi:hypothetical protein
MVPMHTFAHAIRTMSSIGTLDGGKRNVIADASATTRAALIAGTPWLDVFCPGLRHEPGD